MSGTRAVRSASQPKIGSATRRAIGHAAMTMPSVARSMPCSWKYSGRTGRRPPKPSHTMNSAASRGRIEPHRSNQAGMRARGASAVTGSLNGGSDVKGTGRTAVDRSWMRGAGRPRTYHRAVMPAPWLLALGLVLAMIVLIPAKRLQLAGVSGRVTGAYAIALWLLGDGHRHPTGRDPRPPADPADRLPRAVHRRARAGGSRTRPSAARSAAREERHATGRAAARRSGMSGPVALHGGGEFQPGDEPFLQRLLGLAREGSGRAADGPLKVAIVPTAAARGRPDLVGAHGTAAFERVAGRASAGADAVTIDVVPVLDAASASDAGLAARLEAADVIHLPGGDPDLIPSILAGTAAWDAIVAAHRRGAVLAGASAGAMALAGWTWTPGRRRDGSRAGRRTRRRPACRRTPLGRGGPPVRAWGARRARVAGSRRADRRHLRRPDLDPRSGGTGHLGGRRRGLGPVAARPRRSRPNGRRRSGGTLQILETRTRRPRRAYPS